MKALRLVFGGARLESGDGTMVIVTEIFLSPSRKKAGWHLNYSMIDSFQNVSIFVFIFPAVIRRYKLATDGVVG